MRIHTRALALGVNLCEIQLTRVERMEPIQRANLIVDATPHRLPRAREARGCVEAGSPAASRGHVSHALLFTVIYLDSDSFDSSQYGNEVCKAGRRFYHVFENADDDYRPTTTPPTSFAALLHLDVSVLTCASANPSSTSPAPSPRKSSFSPPPPPLLKPNRP